MHPGHNWLGGQGGRLISITLGMEESWPMHLLEDCLWQIEMNNGRDKSQGFTAEMVDSW